ncbi:unnamed protein product, partial [Vitis vinifera]|uniref:Uncharacterized protein n=1 Tax=Vitis vinifera TaxID=29760 RepID=D7T8I8_VITVI
MKGLVHSLLLCYNQQRVPRECPENLENPLLFSSFAKCQLPFTLSQAKLILCRYCGKMYPHFFRHIPSFT